MEYTYTGITTSPNLRTCDDTDAIVSGIHFDVAQSAMTDKGICCCTWDEESATLTVHFTDTLSGADKALLDGIVSANS